MPFLRHSSAVFTPASASLGIARIFLRWIGSGFDQGFDRNDATWTDSPKKEPVDWARDVKGSGWVELGRLEVPHRWNRANTPKIGEWRHGLRQKLEAGLPIDWDGIHKAKCHLLAKKTNGRSSSIEEIEGKSLFSFFAKLERAKTTNMRLKAVIAFANQCMPAVNENLPAATVRGEPVTIRPSTKSIPIAETANAHLAASSATQMLALLSALRAAPGVKVALVRR